MKLGWKPIFPLAMGFALLSACSDFQPTALKLPWTSAAPDNAGGTPQNAKPTTAIARLAEPGMKALAEGDYDSAVKHFEAALASAPESADLHFLTGLAYHYLGHEKDPAYLPIAQAALELALRLDPGHALAARELGQLMLEQGNYNQAEAYFSRAASLQLKDPTTMRGLTLAAYASVDLPVARWASSQLDPAVPDTMRIRALLDGLEGNAETAKQDSAAYRATGPSPAKLQALNVALNEWQDIHEQADHEQVSQLFAPILTGPVDAAPPAKIAGAPEDKGPLSYNWADCTQTLIPPSTAAVAAAVASAATQQDETVVLPPLPSPCKTLPLPRMVQLDASIIRTNINNSSSMGVNLLQSLSLVMNGAVGNFPPGTTTLPATPAIWNTRGFNLSTPTAGITYALNIANQTGQRSEVLSRPSLLALDRQPSEFFSGSNVTVVLNGQLGGGNLGNVPIGINLSATPTFLDDDTFLISVRATRTFFETPSGGSFQQSVQTSRNTVTANAIMKFDQTLVLSGLSERETQDNINQVPGVGHVPVLQYLFNQTSESDFRSYLIILLTPRRVLGPKAVGDPEAALESLSDDDRKRLETFRARLPTDQGFKPLANLTAIRFHIRTNWAFHMITAGTIEDETFQPYPTEADRYKVINELKAFLYF